MKSKEQPVSSASRTKSWWAAVLAGQVDEPHPIHGADLDVTFKGGKLRLSGELVSEEDRKQVVKEAREYMGKGVDEVDDKHLKVAKSKEKPGVLDQTLIAAFSNRDVAGFARIHLVENRRVKPKLVKILEPGQQAEARKILREAFMSDVEKAFKPATRFWCCAWTRPRLSGWPSCWPRRPAASGRSRHRPARAWSRIARCLSYRFGPVEARARPTHGRSPSSASR
jgi:hypothetical protein